MISKITTDCHGREKNTADITAKVQISQRFVARILRKKEYKKVKPSWKPKLLPILKTACLAFAIKYRN